MVIIVLNSTQGAKKKEGSNTNADFTLKKAQIQHLQSL